tara:strand:- start:190 stop:561 length:372 start_codon:yes stop_codon:yes gene_type:complete
MSTLKVTNIQATGETASRAVSGVAAAWVNFNGTGTIAIRDSVNVASLTDNGTGDYTVTYTNAMANSNYAISLASIENNTNGADIYISNNTSPSTTSHILEYVLAGTGKYDVAQVHSTTHGDLA